MRSKSSVLATKVTSVAELPRFKDDSDKENVVLQPPENKPKVALIEDKVSKNIEPILKDSCYQEHPLADRTQASVVPEEFL